MRTVLSRAQSLGARLYTSVILLIWISPNTVLGHALLVDSTPRQNEELVTPPKEIVLQFNARIEKKVTQATLLEGKDHKIKLPPIPEDKQGPPERLVVPLPKLGPGSYRLEYRVLAADGHTTPGLVRFKVSAPREKPPEDPSGGGPK